MRAIVTVEELPDRVRVIIQYEDGHTVRMEVAPDSPVLLRHLGLDTAPGTVPA